MAFDVSFQWLRILVGAQQVLGIHAATWPVGQPTSSPTINYLSLWALFLQAWNFIAMILVVKCEYLPLVESSSFAVADAVWAVAASSAVMVTYFAPLILLFKSHSLSKIISDLQTHGKYILKQPKIYYFIASLLYASSLIAIGFRYSSYPFSLSLKMVLSYYMLYAVLSNSMTVRCFESFFIYFALEMKEVVQLAVGRIFPQLCSPDSNGSRNIDIPALFGLSNIHFRTGIDKMNKSRDDFLRPLLQLEEEIFQVNNKLITLLSLFFTSIFFFYITQPLCTENQRTSPIKLTL